MLTVLYNILLILYCCPCFRDDVYKSIKLRIVEQPEVIDDNIYSRIVVLFGDTYNWVIFMSLMWVCPCYDEFYTLV